MNKELKKILDSILEKLGNESPGVLLEEVKKLETFRPLPSYLFFVKAKIQFELKEYDASLEALSNCEFWWQPSPEASQIADLVSLILKQQGEETPSRQMAILSQYLQYVEPGELIPYHLSVTPLIEEHTQIFYSGEEIELFTFSTLFHEFGYAWRFAESLIFLGFLAKEYGDTFTPQSVERYLKDVLNHEYNAGYIYEVLTSNEDEQFILISDDEQPFTDTMMLAYILKFLGKRVIVFRDAITADMEYEVDLSETVQISLENSRNEEGITFIHPVSISVDGPPVKSNTPQLIAHFTDNSSEKELVYIVAPYKILNSLQSDNAEIQIISNKRNNTYGNFKGIAYSGSYLSYISRIYQIDCFDALKKSPVKKYSIVIPARNSAVTLRETLKSCLAIDYPMEQYEILISDNSTDGNINIENLVTELNDERIVYVKTPRSLPLNRSFEFAFLQCSGDFIIPIGSDDGILPWALDTLDEVQTLYPDEDVLGWHRGFFQWSESQSPQAGKFVIPKNYIKSKYDAFQYSAQNSLKNLLENTEELMYTAPTLYINSGFKRSYLNRLYQETGVLWDGFTQDISMSIINLIINDSFVFMEYPITIAGMADSSLGAKEDLVKRDKKELDEEVAERIAVTGFGVPVNGLSEYQPLAVDINSFWSELFRLQERPRLRKRVTELIDTIDWKSKLVDIYEALNPISLDYYMKLYTLRGSAYAINSEIGNWFDNSLMKKSDDKIYEISNSQDMLTVNTGFETGPNKAGGAVYDAREFEVMTIAQAVSLFAKLSKL